MSCWHPDHYYNMPATHKYFIGLDAETVLRQNTELVLEWTDSIDDMDYLVSTNIKYTYNVSQPIACECSLKNGRPDKKVIFSISAAFSQQRLV